MNNTTSEVRQRADLLWLKATFGLYIVTLVLGFVGNIIVLIVIGLKKTRKHRPHELFILNLAVGDLMLIIFFLPFQISIFVVEFYPSVFYCKFVAPLIAVALGTSVFTLTVMAAHRCYVITNPFKPTISQRSVYIWLVLVWILSVGLVVPKMLVSTAYSNRCIQQWPSQSFRKLYTLSLFVARFVIPLIIITYAYVRIVKELAGSTAPRYDLDENGKIRTRTTRSENIMVVKTLTVIVVLFVLCMLPYRIATIVMIFGDEHQVRLVRYIRQYTSVLTIFHSCVNPIAYGALTKPFRSCLARVCHWFKPCFFCRSAPRAENCEATVNILQENKLSSGHLQSRKLSRLLKKTKKTPVRFQLEAESCYGNMERRETTV